ncbi:FHA domain-containing protein [Leifsonia sp. NPDC080035]|uniref:FHA domain-containing protein n=1 Tax=Leifsonia sp. NPDC080035 TaxID=3143936 RepID=A0AAU7GAN0_9MICO
MGTQDDDTVRDRPGFIVPPPGLIPDRAAASVPARAPEPVALPAFLPPSAPGAPAPRPAPVWRLVVPGGARIPVTGTVLLGRNPAAAAHNGPADLVPLDDPTSTVSKTHAAVSAAGDVLTVTDLHSTNGVVVLSPASGERMLQPGVPAEVEQGGALRLGDLRIGVERA